MGAAVAHLHRTAAPHLSYTTRVAIPCQSELSGKRLLSGMLSALGEVSERVLREGGLPVQEGARGEDEFFVALSAPWVSARTTTLSLRSARAVPITRSLLAKLREEEVAQMAGMVQIEEKLFRTTLEGYETSSPFGKRARVAEFSLFQSFAPAGLPEQIEETISHHLPGRVFSFHAFSLLAFVGLRELVPSARSFFFADVSGEQTEIGVVKNRELTELVSIPFGRNALIRALGRCGFSPCAGASILALHREARGTGARFEQAVKKLREASDEWGRRVRFFLPADAKAETIFLFADEDAGPPQRGARAPEGNETREKHSKV